MATEQLTLDTLHAIVDNVEDDGDEEYVVCVVDEKGFKPYVIREVRVNDETGAKMLVLVIDTSKGNDE